MILDKLVEDVKMRLAERKKIITPKEMKYKGENERTAKNVSFYKQMNLPGISVIAEVKRASPSKGIISVDFPFVHIAKEYENAGAAAISVLTEEDNFKGNIEYLEDIKKCVNIPILQKDFIVDQYQIYEAAYRGADAILLIAAILTVKQMKEYRILAQSLGLDCLVEAHDEHEILKVLKSEGTIIGVNNRDLKTFNVDINTTLKLKKFLPENVLLISESGIKKADDVKKLREVGVDGILIGETLMKAKDIKEKFKELFFYD